MNSHTDQQLLSAYAGSRSDAAFSELVRRHIDFVHSAAVRLVRDAHLAQDVTQAVFLALAHNAPRLAERPVLAGWLHRTAQNLAANVVRSDARRRARECQAASMNESFTDESNPVWEELAPHLDAALGELSATDRDAVLLRYFHRKSAREIARVLGMNEQAAQKRVNRAVERLRKGFTHRGVSVGAGGLVALLSLHAVQAAPAGLAIKISSAAGLAGAAAHTSTALASAKIIAMTALQKTIVTAALLASVGIGLYATRQAMHRRVPAQARSQPPLGALARLAESADRTPASSRRPITVQPANPAKAVSALPKKSAAVGFTSTRIYQLLKQKQPRLALAQLQPYLEANGRNAPSLLAAYRTTGDPSLLAEAVQKFSNDPRVGFEAAIQQDTSPAERRQRLDAFMKADPENSLADYLSALDHFKAGDADAMVKDLVAAQGKAQFRDYASDRKQTDEEAYLAAGYPPGEAKLLGNTFVIEPQLTEFKQLGQQLIGLANSYNQAGDVESGQNALQMVVDLGRRFGDASTAEPLLGQLVGISIERMALEAADPNSPYGTAGQTVAQRLNEILQRKESIHVLTAQADPLWEKLSDQDWINYYAQVASNGEESGLKWLTASAQR